MPVSSCTAHHHTLVAVGLAHVVQPGIALVPAQVDVSDPVDALNIIDIVIAVAETDDSGACRVRLGLPAAPLRANRYIWPSSHWTWIQSNSPAYLTAPQYWMAWLLFWSWSTSAQAAVFLFATASATITVMLWSSLSVPSSALTMLTTITPPR